MPDTNISVRRSPVSIVASPSLHASVFNAGPDTIYYKRQASVTSTDNEGSLAKGEILSWSDSPRWFIAKGGAKIFATYSPEATTDMATQAELDAAVVGAGTAAEIVAEKTARESADAAIKAELPVFNVKSATYGAKGDNATDDSAAIQAAIDAASTAEGGVVYLPTGTYLVGTALQIKTKVKIMGAGFATKVKLKNTSNTHVFTTYKIGENGQDFYAISDLWIDGNKSNNASGGNGIYSDGRRVQIERVIIASCKENGIQHKQSASDLSNAEGGSDSTFRNIWAFSNEKNGILSEAHDASWVTCRLPANKEAGFKNTGVANILIDVHGWGAQEYAFNFEGSFDAVNCQGEGASVAEVRCKSGGRWTGGRVFVAGTPENVPGFLLVENSTELHTSNVSCANHGTGGAFQSGGASVGSGSILEFHYTGAGVAFNKAGNTWSGNIEIRPTLRGTTTIGEPPGPNEITAAEELSPASNSRVYRVTGATEIKKIKATYAGHVLFLRFSSTPKVADGENLKLNGILEATAETTLTLACDGTNWYEIARSKN